ncbi:MAG TPA: acyclic terpene utilization AtuA family protein [Opitutaceae bacterium]|nr:acyclic terpene utilization AtuA family protein [Opitutaceae bacterium]
MHTNEQRIIRIGCGAGFSGDRIEPAVELAEQGGIQYLVFECLAERTIALAQQSRLQDPSGGYDPLLVARMEAVLPLCRKNGIRIITNMGAANPRAAAAQVVEVARRLNLTGLKVAAVTGDEVKGAVVAGDFPVFERNHNASALGDRLVSAHAYLGAAPIVEALQAGADVVLTGRVADPALFLAPLMHEFEWKSDDWHRLGQGTLVGHLLECAGQITGGYFADAGRKRVENLARLGFPIAEVSEDGAVVITKVPGSGGTVTARTCKEQLLYEIHDPAAYVTPDVIADFSAVVIEEIGPDRVAISGATGRVQPEKLKVLLGYRDGFVGEGQISYAGTGAVARGELALEIVRERFKLLRFEPLELRGDLIGVNSVFPSHRADTSAEVPEVRVRVTGRTETLEDALRIGNEVETLYTNGPAAGGGVTKSAREVIALLSILIPRELARPKIQYSVT